MQVLLLLIIYTKCSIKVTKSVSSSNSIVFEMFFVFHDGNRRNSCSKITNKTHETTETEQDLWENCSLTFWIYLFSFLSNFLSFWYIFLSLLVTFSLFNCCYNQFRNNTMLQFTPIIFIAFLWHVYVIVFCFFIPFNDRTLH